MRSNDPTPPGGNKTGRAGHNLAGGGPKAMVHKVRVATIEVGAVHEGGMKGRSKAPIRASWS